MADSGFATNVTQEDLQRILTNALPVAEGVAPMPGGGSKASRDDHMHPRLSSATIGSLDSNAEAIVPFSRTFSAQPVVIPTLVELADNQPVVFKVKSYTKDAQGNYTGCVIKGYRSSVLPSLSGILLIGPLLSALANYNVFGGSAANAQFCCFAVQAST